jgi:hypothetical protein
MAETVFACNPFAMTAGQRDSYRAARGLVESATLSVEEIADGSAARLDPREDVILAAAQFVALERLCCPFLSFRLDLTADGALTLSLTGAEGVKGFLIDEIEFLARNRSRE